MSFSSDMRDRCPCFAAARLSAGLGSCVAPSMRPAGSDSAQALRRDRTPVRGSLLFRGQQPVSGRRAVAPCARLAIDAGGVSSLRMRRFPKRTGPRELLTSCGVLRTVAARPEEGRHGIDALRAGGPDTVARPRGHRPLAADQPGALHAGRHAESASTGDALALRARERNPSTEARIFGSARRMASRAAAPGRRGRALRRRPVSVRSVRAPCTSGLLGSVTCEAPWITSGRSGRSFHSSGGDGRGSRNAQAA